MLEVEKEGEAGHRFLIKNEQGLVIFTSVLFEDADKITQLRKQLSTAIGKPSLIERKTGYEGKFHFNLKDEQGKMIGSSPPFQSEAGMENGIENLQNRISELS